MSELKLSFSKEKKIEFLKKHGFNILKVDVYRVRPVYHNDVEYIYFKEDFAFFNAAIKDKFKEDYDLASNKPIDVDKISLHSIDSCFNTLIHIKILEI